MEFLKITYRKGGEAKNWQWWPSSFCSSRLKNSWRLVWRHIAANGCDTPRSTDLEKHFEVIIGCAKLTFPCKETSYFWWKELEKRGEVQRGRGQHTDWRSGGLRSPAPDLVRVILPLRTQHPWPLSEWVGHMLRVQSSSMFHFVAWQASSPL